MKIAFVGKMCSGKTWCVEYLQTLNSSFYVTRFAKMVKVIARDLFFMTEKNRTLLQQIGTNMRQIRPTVFVDYVVQECKGISNCLLDDARYINEIMSLKKNGWIIVKLNITPELQKKRLMVRYPKTWKDHLSRGTHISEVEQDSMDSSSYDCIINVDNENVGNRLEELYLENLLSI